MEKTTTGLQADQDSNLSRLQDFEIKELVDGLTREVEQLTTQLNNLQQQLPSLQEQYTNKQTTLNDLMSHCCHDNQSHCYHDEVGVLVDESRKMSDQIMERRKQVATLETQLEQLRSVVTSNLSSEVVALRSQLTDKKELVQQLEHQISSAGWTAQLWCPNQTILLPTVSQFC
ncbi:paramyosin-like isoform X2 [Dysidea avara]|uniref:paramyosin-like isoform X2 n=1 Tax=Dysidea avara TaxID=196820 RepID=UPI00332F3A6E